jgi:hypothetical protein
MQRKKTRASRLLRASQTDAHCASRTDASSATRVQTVRRWQQWTCDARVEGEDWSRVVCCVSLLIFILIIIRLLLVMI